MSNPGARSQLDNYVWAGIALARHLSTKPNPFAISNSASNSNLITWLADCAFANETRIYLATGNDIQICNSFWNDLTPVGEYALVTCLSSSCPGDGQSNLDLDQIKLHQVKLDGSSTSGTCSRIYGDEEGHLFSYEGKAIGKYCMLAVADLSSIVGTLSGIGINTTLENLRKLKLIGVDGRLLMHLSPSERKKSVMHYNCTKLESLRAIIQTSTFDVPIKKEATPEQVGRIALTEFLQIFLKGTMMTAVMTRLWREFCAATLADESNFKKRTWHSLNVCCGLESIEPPPANISTSQDMQRCAWVQLAAEIKNVLRRGMTRGKISRTSATGL
jgi:hypothetical protein